MNRCPRCHSEFADHILHCINDGQRLEPIGDSVPPVSETVRRLDALLDAETPMAVARAARLVIALCAALAKQRSAASANKVLNPQAIFITEPSGEAPPQIKIEADQTPATDAESAPGTLYTAPEIATPGLSSAAADVYSIGAIAYKMLTGEPPFAAATRAALRVKQLLEHPRPLAALRPDIPPRLEAVIQRALENDPAARPTSIAQLQNEIEAALVNTNAPPAQEMIGSPGEPPHDSAAMPVGQPASALPSTPPTAPPSAPLPAPMAQASAAAPMAVAGASARAVSAKSKLIAGLLALLASLSSLAAVAVYLTLSRDSGASGPTTTTATGSEPGRDTANANVAAPVNQNTSAPANKNRPVATNTSAPAPAKNPPRSAKPKAAPPPAGPIADDSEKGKPSPEAKPAPPPKPPSITAMVPPRPAPGAKMAPSDRPKPDDKVSPPAQPTPAGQPPSANANTSVRAKRPPPPKARVRSKPPPPRSTTPTPAAATPTPQATLAPPVQVPVTAAQAAYEARPVSYGRWLIPVILLCAALAGAGLAWRLLRSRNSLLRQSANQPTVASAADAALSTEARVTASSPVDTQSREPDALTRSVPQASVPTILADTGQARESFHRCPACQTEYAISVRFCVHDGTTLQEASKTVPPKDEPSFYDLQTLEPRKRCPQCGAEYPLTKKFCRYDGEKLVEMKTPSAPAVDASPMAPIVIGQYRCFARLGEGGMGIVYKAQHVHLKRLSAIKVLLPQTAMLPDAVQMFRREAQLASSINHPNSILIYDYGELSTNLFYLAMEFVAGASLAAIIAPEGVARPLPLARVLDIARQVAEALDAAHQLGIIHRDLKPQNVMITMRASGGDFVKVVDFGIARSLRLTADFETLPGVIVGTPAYMSPEQARGMADLDGRSDIYSLGVMVYQMLGGVLPFPAKGISAWQQIDQRASLRELPPPLDDLRPDLHIPGAVGSAVMRALDPDRDRRYRSALDFLHDLSHAARPAH